MLKYLLGIAQIVFETLDDKPERLYGRSPKDSFQDEFNYRGYGSYKNEYNSDIQKLSKIKENIKDKEIQIYANVLTFMGILMGIFSVIILNLEAFAQSQITVDFILAFLFFEVLMNLKYKYVLN